MTDEPLLASGEVARRCGVAVRTVTSWVNTGVLKPARTTAGGRYRFLWSEVEQQLAEWRERQKAERDQT